MEKQMLLTIGVSFVLTLVIGRFVLTELRKLIDEKNPGCELEVDGGVDPETSHSTIEMRRAIVEFNLPLFGLKNVTLTDSHAVIQGSRASYTVHLGSGVVHQKGGAMLHILPVHSQRRGKLFLPFVDEDPKTAEIMSKIVLLAEDKKIKDPFILDQIR